MLNSEGRLLESIIYVLTAHDKYVTGEQGKKKNGSESFNKTRHPHAMPMSQLNIFCGFLHTLTYQ